ncbi:MAG TPA: DUF4123 domain-containing protein [Blastocatellia bacterium]
MATFNQSEKISRQLFANEEASVFAVLDGASASGLLDKLYGLQPEFECLYRGEIEPDIAYVAPYLVRLDADSEFARWTISQGWGRHWGIFVTSSEDFRALRRHLRMFLVVYDADGRPLRFRYYDPRVLRTYLPTCTTGELSTIFGPVSSYIAEATDPHTMLRFSVNSGALLTKELSLKGA